MIGRPRARAVRWSQSAPPECYSRGATRRRLSNFSTQPIMSDPVNSNPDAPEPTTSPEPEESFKEAFRPTKKAMPESPKAARSVAKARSSPLPPTPSFSTSASRAKAFFRLPRCPQRSCEAWRQTAGDRQGPRSRGLLRTDARQSRTPTDWASLQKAFDEKATIVGTVTGVVKGGLSVDVGVRAFMPASRTGTRDAAEMAKLVEQEIRCRITKIDVEDEDVVVDRRVIAEDEETAAKQRRYDPN
jgi:small subunit ribosomal protein S1